ncbi:MAG: trehalose-phosphatase [Rhodobacteraceae bacterium]|nr:trehalose-phosphatase [Paracoccaceae bacterium]
MKDVPYLEPGMALFLDFDGTLVEFAPRPDAVEIAPGLQVLLEKLCEHLDGALAIVTGRPISQIDGFLAPLLLPAAGLHGLEMRFEAQKPTSLREPDSDIMQLKARLQASRLLQEGAFFEDKGPAAALHYRDAPNLRDAVIEEMKTAIADLPSLHLITGKMVVEAKPNTSDKGEAVQAFLKQPQFAGCRPVFIGDDVTDEDGMAAAQDCGGFGVKVGQGGTSALHRLADVTAVQEWLKMQVLRLEN